MKFRFRYAVLPCLLPAFAAACSTEATHRRPNIFDDEESFAAVTFSSNADSLFLSWELTDDRIQFDSYRITDNKSQQVLTVGRDETSCLLTHVPHNEPVAVYLSLVAAMLVGRLVSGVTKALFFMAGQYTMQAWIAASFVTALPGIVLQLAVVPSIVYYLMRAGLIPQRYPR